MSCLLHGLLSTPLDETKVKFAEVPVAITRLNKQIWGKKVIKACNGSGGWTLNWKCQMIWSPQEASFFVSQKITNWVNWRKLKDVEILKYIERSFTLYTWDNAVNKWPILLLLNFYGGILPFHTFFVPISFLVPAWGFYQSAFPVIWALCRPFYTLD